MPNSLRLNSVSNSIDNQLEYSEYIFYNEEAEKGVLAASLISPLVVEQIVQNIIEKDFYFDIHKLIFKKILGLYTDSIPIDIITLNNVLKSLELYQKFGGYQYLDSLSNIFPVLGNIEVYVKILKEKSRLRDLYKACQDIVNKIHVSSLGSIQELLDYSESIIFKVAQDKSWESFRSLDVLMNNVLDSLIKQYQNREKLPGLSTGFFDLDNVISGLQPSDLIILASRPSMGKTAFALNILENVAIQQKKAVAFFSLEMSAEQICQRLISSYLRIDGRLLKTGYIPKDRFPDIALGVGELSKAKFYIDDSATLTFLEIRARARRLMSKDTVELLVVDYLQLIRGEKSQDNRQYEVAEISRSLKGLARELKIPIIVLSQLSRMVEVRGGAQRPKLSDLRDSGAIEQDADIVCFIYREEYYSELSSEENKGKAEIIISKHRNGPTGSVLLRFNKSIGRFDNAQHNGY